jgi:hypothetical protein
MTFTYDPEQLDNALYRVRLELGDTNSNRQLLLDEEIQQIISEESKFRSRVARCCRLICAKFAGDPAKLKVGEYSHDQRNIIDVYEAMAKKFESMASTGPWIASIEASTKETNEEDDSLIKPIFKRDIHSNE